MSTGSSSSPSHDAVIEVPWKSGELWRKASRSDSINWDATLEDSEHMLVLHIRSNKGTFDLRRFLDNTHDDSLVWKAMPAVLPYVRHVRATTMLSSQRTEEALRLVLTDSPLLSSIEVVQSTVDQSFMQFFFQLLTSVKSKRLRRLTFKGYASTYEKPTLEKDSQIVSSLAGLDWLEELELIRVPYQTRVSIYRALTGNKSLKCVKLDLGEKKGGRAHRILQTFLDSLPQLKEIHGPCTVTPKCVQRLTHWTTDNLAQNVRSLKQCRSLSHLAIYQASRQDIDRLLELFPTLDSLDFQCCLSDEELNHLFRSLEQYKGNLRRLQMGRNCVGRVRSATILQFEKTLKANVQLTDLTITHCQKFLPILRGLLVEANTCQLQHLSLECVHTKKSNEEVIKIVRALPDNHTLKKVSIVCTEPILLTHEVVDWKGTDVLWDTLLDVLPRLGLKELQLGVLFSKGGRKHRNMTEELAKALEQNTCLTRIHVGTKHYSYPATDFVCQFFARRNRLQHLLHDDDQPVSGALWPLALQALQPMDPSALFLAVRHMMPCRQACL